MIKKLYSFLDTKAGVFTPPIPAFNDAVISRTAALEVAAGNGTPLATFPNDFVIYQVGEWDDASGAFSSFEHRVVCSVSDAFAQAKRDYETFKKQHNSSESTENINRNSAANS